MRLLGQVSEMRNACNILVRRDYLKDRGVDLRIILKLILKEWGMTLWTGFFWLRIGTSDGSCEYGNEPSGSTEDGGLLTS
jgi:hypothetical protein